ncbi:hypothetical protein MVEN_02309700 [Mycena venus]|uniref:Uncharacterized protein n=1 Tax=Mycena venus TaxID=2733690 RepID=A0A8H6X4J8_9AGAR|nr:hypothetical protein MVEN_02309700 [Mycena venus]
MQSVVYCALKKKRVAAEEYVSPRPLELNNSILPSTFTMPPPTQFTSYQETCRLFGPLYRPYFDTNVRHRALLRKALELFTPDNLYEIFSGDPKSLRLTMGNAYTFLQFGKITSNFVLNYRLVRRETPAPNLEGRLQLAAYRDAFDTHFKPQGNSYAVRDPEAKDALQAAEQAWHDFITIYNEDCGIIDRPAWAFEPLPGFQRVRGAPPVAVARRRRPRVTAVERTPVAALPLLAITPASGAATRTPFPVLPPLIATPAPLGSRLRPFDVDQHYVPRTPIKRPLAVIDISSDEEDLRPCKRLFHLGTVDLTD